MTATGSGPVAPNQKTERKRQKHTLESLLKTGDIHNQGGSIAHENPGSVLNENQQPHVRAFVAIAIYTGARKGSILALTWDRVDWDTGMIDFQEANRPITGKRRSIVPMTRALRAEMEKAREYADGDFVIHWHGKQVPTGLRWSFSKACERAQLTWKPTPHHLKHSVASWFAMDRVPIDQAADWLATDPATLRRVYRKFDPAYLREIADAFEL